MTSVRNLSQLFSQINEPWKPAIAAELNGQAVKLARISGEFIWHQHDHEDELFLVHRGQLRLEFRDHAVVLGPGDFVVVPRGVEHRPVALVETELVMFEPVETLNTGNVQSERTVTELRVL